jgi:hypothetical protein
LDWLTGIGSQGQARAKSARTLRRETVWCWRIEPRIEPTGEVYGWLQLDGLYAAGMCVLIAASISGPVIWGWCDREKQPAWAVLLCRCPPPEAVVCDGQPGLLAALKTCWPKTRVQRCLVHVLRDVKTHLTQHPKTPAGKALLRLAKELTGISTAEAAAEWLARLDAWWQGFGHLTTQKTFRAEISEAEVPPWAKPTQKWWYTHARLRRAWRLLERLARERTLFAFCDPELAHLGIPSTTNRIEGAINAQLRRLLGHHRGMPPAHQQRAIEWWLYLHHEHHAPPETLIRAEHWQPPKKTSTPEPDQPAGYDTGLSAEEGLWPRKGWAGRPHR